MQKQLERVVIDTIIYFDLFAFPLTKEELFAYLWKPVAVSYEEFLRELEELKNSNKVEEKYGYYFLPGRAEIVEKRRERLVVSEQKLKIARKAARRIRSIPFVRAVFVCNTVGWEQGGEESDIDFLVITNPKRIWIARFLTNLILRMFRLRTYGKKIKNRICLSFFLDCHHLSLSNYRVVEDDIHFAYWLYQMLPVYDPEHYYEKFLNANSWARKFLPNAAKTVLVPSRIEVKDNSVGKIWKRMWEKMWSGLYGDIIEKQSRATQWLKMRTEVKEKVNRGDKGVVISEGILKFHELDTRQNYRNQWLKKIKEYYG